MSTDEFRSVTNYLRLKEENSKCARCGNSKKFHPMSIADGLGHRERCDFVKHENKEVKK